MRLGPAYPEPGWALPLLSEPACLPNAPHPPPPHTHTHLWLSAPPRTSALNASAEIADAVNHPLIRLFTVGQRGGMQVPQPLTEFTTLEQNWSVASPAAVGNGDFSFFSVRLLPPHCGAGASLRRGHCP